MTAVIPARPYVPVLSLEPVRLRENYRSPSTFAEDGTVYSSGSIIFPQK